MKLVSIVKPFKSEGRTKETIIHKNRLYGFTISNYGSYYKEDDKYVYVVNFQKFNKKTKQTQKVVKGKNVTTSKIIREAHWVGYVYSIPKAWLDIEKKKVVQKKRNFIIVKK